MVYFLRESSLFFENALMSSNFDSNMYWVDTVQETEAEIKKKAELMPGKESR